MCRIESAINATALDIYLGLWRWLELIHAPVTIRLQIPDYQRGPITVLALPLILALTLLS